MKVVNFIHETDWKNLPQEVRSQARRCLLDTLGAAISGRQTVLSQIIHDFAASNFGGSDAQLWLDGRNVSPPGAALANGMTIDALGIAEYHGLRSPKRSVELESMIWYCSDLSDTSELVRLLAEPA